MPSIRGCIGCALLVAAVVSSPAWAQVPDVTTADESSLEPAASKPATSAAEVVPVPDEQAELLAAGNAAFERSCIGCHDAQKSLTQARDFAAWQATIRRMADKDGAQIPVVTHNALAAWLTSVAGPQNGSSPPGAELLELPAIPSPAISANAALSATFRGGDHEVQNQNHFGDAWIGLFAQNGSPVSGRVTACVACHNQGSQFGNLELVEACLRLDLGQCAFGEAAAELPAQANVEAGRFVVPFGLYYQQVNPGINRTVSAPLIYNMGQRVFPWDLGPPVLPMPYSDEGASLNLLAPLSENVNATLHGYLVNGLSGGSQGISFDTSRDYVDNNRSPAVGGRVALGSQVLSLGASAMAGRYSHEYSSWDRNLDYAIFGGDLALRWEDRLWIQCEYAERRTDRQGYWYYGPGPYPLAATSADLIAVPYSPFSFQERTRGWYSQLEALLSRTYRISALLRFDMQFSDSVFPPPGSRLASGNFDVERFTYGLNFTLPGGSLLMLNHEHWWLPEPLRCANVFGVRWAATF